MKLSQRDLKSIEKYCGEEYAKRCRALIERQKNDKVRIVNTGMVSSGKSSLYNALIDSGGEYFPTGAARTTTRADYFDCGLISYVDTPGIDVRSEDDALAFDTIMEADRILMVHNIRTGPLNRSEAAWLERIARGMEDSGGGRLVFALSWIDTREKEEDYGELVENVKKQVFEIAGAEIPFFEVSVKKYQQGIEKDKEILVRNSGVGALKEYLEASAASYLEMKRDVDQREFAALMGEIRAILCEQRDSREKEKKAILKKACDRHKSRKSAWNVVYDYFSAQRKRLADLESELEQIDTVPLSLFLWMQKMQNKTGGK